MSPSSRRAWIEIAQTEPGCLYGHVALLAEGVDRNLKAHKYKSFPTASPSSRRAWIEISSHSPLRNLQKVAHRPGGVDIKLLCEQSGVQGQGVALLAEGVDRNFHRDLSQLVNVLSPSSRRAWIEIAQCISEEGGKYGSPSSRRAWIEIGGSPDRADLRRVALLAEGVDRNQIGVDFCLLVNGRPPRGGRG